MSRKKTIPGSIYVQNGRTKLMIKFQGRRIATGLEDTKEGRKIAMQLFWSGYIWRAKVLRLLLRKKAKG